MKMQISKNQLAQIVRSIEKGMKGGGPDDYSVPQVMEYYLYRHPMSMMEFYVDHGGIASGGLGKSIKRKLIKFKDIVGKVAKKIGQSKQFQEAVAKGGEKAKKVVEDKVSDKLRDLREQVTSSMADKAEVAGSGHKKMCGCGPGKDSMRREEDAEGKARDMRRRGRARNMNDLVGSDNAQQGRGYKMHGHGHKKMHGSHSDMEGGAFADGSDMGVTGVGLQLSQMGFVTTQPARAPAGSVAVPFTNHLRLHTANETGPPPPAGGYGSSAMAIAGGAWGG
jgi:hypothetical protein